jgi:diguanylate cyclase
MPDALHSPPDPEQGSRQTATRLQSLPQRTYRFRVLGMGLGALPLIAVMRELDSSWPAWAWMVFGCFVWPHLAYLIARRSADPFRAELRNFLLDSCFAGSWVPLMHFNLLPSVVLLSVVSADKINSGIRGLWQRSLPGMLLSMLAMGLFTGFALQPVTSMTVMLASLPILVIHTLAVSLGSYQLVRRVQRQNLQLETLSQRDALTGLDNRGHWETLAEALLKRHQSSDQPATLMLIDSDHFKDINDRYGHPAGDQVLSAVAATMRDFAPSDALVARVGGEEFVLVLDNAQHDRAQVVADGLRRRVRDLAIDIGPRWIQVTVSIGVACTPLGGNTSVRELYSAADEALYEAKRAGRDCVRVAAQAA